MKTAPVLTPQLMPTSLQRYHLPGEKEPRLTVYLEQDEFLNARTAGAIDTTACEPGPGARGATDTTGKLTIANNLLVCAGGKPAPAWGDPSFWISPLGVGIPRLAGQLMIAHLNKTAGATQLYLGLSQAPAGDMANGFAFQFNNLVVSLKNGGTNINSILNIVAGTDYQFCIALRATGIMYLIKGGAFPYWTILGDQVNVATSPLYPGITNLDAAWNSGYIRIPQERWLPAPVASDNFNHAAPLGSTISTPGKPGRTP